MKLLLKILGGILYGCFIILECLMYLCGLIVTVYGIVWAWKSPAQNMETRILMTGLCVIGLIMTLAMVYLAIDGYVNPTVRSWDTPSKPITPTCLQVEKKPKPILGSNKASIKVRKS